MLLFGFNTLRDYNNSPLLLIIVHCYTWAAASLSYVATYVPLVALNIKYVCSMMRISNSEYITGQGGLYHLRFSVCFAVAILPVLLAAHWSTAFFFASSCFLHGY